MIVGQKLGYPQSGENIVDNLRGCSLTMKIASFVHKLQKFETWQ